MPFHGLVGARKPVMVKDSVAERLRDEIIRGTLMPGDRVVEGKWAAKLGVAQASVREAINILTAEGFLEKDSGQSARVVLLTEDDVAQMYQVRSSLESLAARLFVEKRADLGNLEQALADMGAAVACKNAQAFYARDVRFHLLIAEGSGNRYLEQELRHFLVPLFAFVVIRVHGTTGENGVHWLETMEQHRKLLDVLRSGDPLFAEHHVRESVHGFREYTERLLQKSKGSAQTKSTGQKPHRG